MPDLNPTEAPLVSVVIPTYNRSDYLQEAIASALGQTYTNIEVVVTDDCSPQSPEPLIRGFNDPRIRFLQNDQNLGITLNITSGFEAAKGKYVASLNDDDRWTPDFLTRLVPHLEANPQLSVAFCDHYVIDAAGEIDHQATAQNSHEWKRDWLSEAVYQPFWHLALVDRAVSCAAAAVIRNDAIAWSELRAAGQAGMGRHWDYFLGYLACREGHGAYFCPEYLTEYRAHTQNITQLTNRKNNTTKINSGFSRVYCYERFLADDRLKDLWPYFKQQLAVGKTTLGIGMLRDGKTSQARAYFWQALQQNVNLRTAAALTLSFMPSLVTSRV
ncbi:glycosyltransferase family 2 protein [Nodosilinea sp. LEGE 07088]|uniref:glycosyltransferase family 2 protein n=1 Tax=Nodosilinea sp. LEGE 07088 TaxID=2777968 RepID=UPI001882B814|nr:glycosyltransferase family 2 protein [Nodosilinea sp. LEGE 07088]MBE9139443.1 glycosyltransferase family 2 protein [Nodosilinea sp. LEGE 07088]